MRTRFGRCPRRLAVVATAVAALALTACGTSSSSTTTTSSRVASSTSTTSGGSSATSTTSAASKQSLAEISSKLAAGQDRTYLADYKIKSTENGGVENGTFTIAHAGSNTLFAATTAQGAFEEILSNSKSTICAHETGKWMCFSGALAATVKKDVSVFVDNFSAKSELAKLRAEESGAYGASTSTRTFAGQSVTCLTYHVHLNNGTFTVCVTSQGVMAEAIGENQSGRYSLTLTKLTPSVPSNEFTPPAKSSAT